MAPGIGVITLVLVAAALHATWNALVKAGGDRLSVMAVTMGLPALPFAVTTTSGAVWRKRCRLMRA